MSCGCSSGACGCTFVSGPGITVLQAGDTVTISGTVLDAPIQSVESAGCIGLEIVDEVLVPTVLLAATQNPAVQLGCTEDGLAATVAIDPASTAPVSVTDDGLRVDCCTDPELLELIEQAQDTADEALIQAGEAALDAAAAQGDAAAAQIDAAAALADVTAHISDPTDAHDASAISYDNTSSGLVSGDVQAAIDELAAGGTSLLQVVTANTNTTITSSDEVVLVTGGVTITLPATHTSGQAHEIKDAAGTGAASPITIAGNGNLIDGASSTTISTNWASVRAVSNGTDWFLF